MLHLQGLWLSCSSHLLSPKLTFQSINKTPYDHSSLSKGGGGRRKRRIPLSSTASMMAFSENPRKAESWVEFPKLPPAQRTLMETLITTLNDHLDPQLNPCLTSPDVRFFQNKEGTSQGSVNLRAGAENSKVHFILGSWLHCELPFGVLSITTLMCMLNTNTDAPHFVLELIQSSPTSLLLVLDLPPRKDLVLHPDYLKKFYEDTQLDLQRQKLEKLPVVQPYVSPFLSIRANCSPTAILSKINCDSQVIDGKKITIEDLIGGSVGNVVKEVMSIWLEKCVNHQEAEMDEVERNHIRVRDNMVKRIQAEVDLGMNLPRLFDSDITVRVLAALRKGV